MLFWSLCHYERETILGRKIADLDLQPTGVIKCDPILGVIKQCKCMVNLRGSPIKVHCLGWLYNDPCVYKSGPRHQL